MPKFSGKQSSTAVLSPVKTVSMDVESPDTTTYEGGAGFTRDAKSELFLLAVSNLVGEDTFYEKANDRDSRYRTLIRKVMATDPGWIARLIPYLRNEVNLRSAPIVMAAEAVKVGLEISADVNLRSMVDSAIVRADEPAEMIGYWLRAYGKSEPKPLKRGVADAVRRVYNEFSALKYDSREASVRMGDVIERVHPEPRDERQRQLFQYLIDRRHNRDEPRIGEELRVIRARLDVDKLSTEDFRDSLVGEQGTTGNDLMELAGPTWEYASAKYGKLDAAFWEAMIPRMGYMALLRNLRNFDDVGISTAMKDRVAAKLRDPIEVAKSRQLPLRFYNAYREAKGFHWAPALESALESSLANVPEFPGRTLVLVDCSGSMYSSFSQRGTAQRYELAGIFGGALAKRGEKVDLVAFGSGSEILPFRKGDPLLRIVDQLPNLGGTETWQAYQRHYDGHDRTVIITDEQAWPAYGLFGVSRRPQVIGDKPIYTFNVAGYRAGHAPSGSGNMHTFGGLTDAGFKVIRLIEQASKADWPF